MFYRGKMDAGTNEIIRQIFEDIRREISEYPISNRQTLYNILTRLEMIMFAQREISTYANDLTQYASLQDAIAYITQEIRNVLALLMETY